jgi:HSP20 family protein
MAKDLERLGRQMSAFVERVLREKSTLMNVYEGTWRPSIDILETEDRILVIVDLAGVSRKDIAIEMHGERLRIAGFRSDPSEEHQEDVRRCHQVEIDYGPFERQLLISVPIDVEHIEARYEDGFLKIALPKKEKELARKIEIL